MQAQDQAGRFRRLRRMTEIFGAQFGETEFLFARHFPQEVQVDVGGDGLGLLQQLGRRRLVELQHHVLGFDLVALAACHLNLVGLARLRQYAAYFEIARFFKNTFISRYSVQA